MSASPDTVVTVTRERVTHGISATTMTADYAAYIAGRWQAVDAVDAAHFADTGRTVARITDDGPQYSQAGLQALVNRVGSPDNNHTTAGE